MDSLSKQLAAVREAAASPVGMESWWTSVVKHRMVRRLLNHRMVRRVRKVLWRMWIHYSFVYRLPGPPSDWLEMPPDLLCAVVRRLPLRDAVRAARVCKGWHTSLRREVARSDPLILFGAFCTPEPKLDHVLLYRSDKGFSRRLSLECYNSLRQPCFTHGRWVVSWDAYAREIHVSNLVTHEFSHVRLALGSNQWLFLYRCGLIKDLQAPQESRILYLEASRSYDHNSIFTIFPAVRSLSRMSEEVYKGNPCSLPIQFYIYSSLDTSNLVVVNGEAYFLAKYYSKSKGEDLEACLYWYNLDADTWGHLPNNKINFSESLVLGSVEISVMASLVNLHGMLGVFTCSIDPILKFEISFLLSTHKRPVKKTPTTATCDHTTPVQQVVMPLRELTTFMLLLEDLEFDIQSKHAPGLFIRCHQCNDLYVHMFCSTIAGRIVAIIVYDVNRDLWDVVSLLQHAHLQEYRYKVMPLEMDTSDARKAISENIFPT